MPEQSVQAQRHQPQNEHVRHHVVHLVQKIKFLEQPVAKSVVADREHLRSHNAHPADAHSDASAGSNRGKRVRKSDKSYLLSVADAAQHLSSLHQDLRHIAKPRVAVNQDWKKSADENDEPRSVVRQVEPNHRKRNPSERWNRSQQLNNRVYGFENSPRPAHSNRER